VICRECQQAKPVGQIRTCWCQQDFCDACLAAHLLACEQLGQLPPAPKPTPRRDQTPAKIAAGFQRLSEAMRNTQIGKTQKPVRRWWDR